MEVLVNAMTVTILQYINVSNQHTVYLEFAQCYVNYSIKLGENGNTKDTESLRKTIFNKRNANESNPRYIPKRTKNIHSHKNLYKDVQSSIFLKSQEEERAQMSINC